MTTIDIIVITHLYTHAMNIFTNSLKMVVVNHMTYAECFEGIFSG